MDAVSAEHTVLPLTENSFFSATIPAGGAAAIPVDNPVLLPPTPAVLSVVVPPISALCQVCAVVPDVGAFTPARNLFSCCVIAAAAPSGIPSVRGADGSALFLPQPLLPPKMVSASPIALSKWFFTS